MRDCPNVGFQQPFAQSSSANVVQPLQGFSTYSTSSSQLGGSQAGGQRGRGVWGRFFGGRSRGRG